MVYDKANELAADIKASEEYKRFNAAKDRIKEGSTTETLLKEYRKLQLRAQAAMVAGEEDKDCMEQLQKLGEILQMDKDASEFLISEFMLSRMLGDIYKILAEAVDMDLGMLEG